MTTRTMPTIATIGPITAQIFYAVHAAGLAHQVEALRGPQAAEQEQHDPEDNPYKPHHASPSTVLYPCVELMLSPDGQRHQTRTRHRVPAGSADAQPTVACSGGGCRAGSIDSIRAGAAGSRDGVPVRPRRGADPDRASSTTRPGPRCSTSSCATARRATGTPFVPFDRADDYNRYVDGRPRADGVRTFLTSRGITLPEGRPDDPAGALTVNGLGNRKNEVLLGVIRSQGVEAYEGSVRYLRAAQRGRAAPGGRLGQRQLRRRAGRGRDRRPARGPGRRDRRRGRGAARQAGAGHVPRRRPPARRRAGPGGRVRGRGGRRAGRPGRRVRRRWSGSTGSATPTTFGPTERPLWSKT